MVSKFIKRGTNMANEKEHGNIGQFWKGTEANKDPPPLWETLSPLLVRTVHWFSRQNNLAAPATLVSE